MAEARPEALPHAQRTVGQLVAESIRFYGAHFWQVLVLGIPFVLLDFGSIDQEWQIQMAWGWVIGPLICAAYVRASMLVTGGEWSWVAFGVASLIYLPYPVLGLYVLPAVFWFALVGLAVPASVAEELDGADSLRRGFRLGRADFVHAAGSLATLALVVGVSRIALEILLNTQADQARVIAVALADLVLSPLFYVGGALLYYDQAARVETE